FAGNCAVIGDPLSRWVFDSNNCYIYSYVFCVLRSHIVAVYCCIAPYHCMFSSMCFDDSVVQSDREAEFESAPHLRPLRAWREGAANHGRLRVRDAYEKRKCGVD